MIHVYARLLLPLIDSALSIHFLRGPEFLLAAATILAGTWLRLCT